MNLISALLNQGEQSYFADFSQDNIKNSKNTAKWIKKIILLKRPNYAPTNDIIDNNGTRTDVSGIAKTF